MTVRDCDFQPMTMIPVISIHSELTVGLLFKLPYTLSYPIATEAGCLSTSPVGQSKNYLHKL